MSKHIDIIKLEELLYKTEFPLSACEILGLLSALHALNQADKQNELLDLSDIEQNTQQKCHKILKEINEDIQYGLNSEDFDFSLLLPQRTYLREKAEDLVAWLRGFHIAVNYLIHHYPYEYHLSLNEFMQDIEQLQRLDCSGIGNDSQAEIHLFEIEEYIRVGCMLLREENRAVTV